VEYHNEYIVYYSPQNTTLKEMWPPRLVESK
jgi:hypothetical protein